MAIGIFPPKSAMLTFSYTHKQSSRLNCCQFEIKKSDHVFFKTDILKLSYCEKLPVNLTG